MTGNQTLDLVLQILSAVSVLVGLITRIPGLSNKPAAVKVRQVLSIDLVGLVAPLIAVVLSVVKASKPPADPPAA